MKVLFAKIGDTKKDFKVVSDKISFSGLFCKLNNGLVLLDGNLSGCIDIDCSRCGDTFVKTLDEDIKLYLSNTKVNHHELGLFDIIEVDKYIDFEKILKSEVESIKLDLNYCKKCDNLDEMSD